MNVKKAAALTVFIFVLVCMAPFSAFALGEREPFDASERADDAISGFYNELPDSARDYLDDNDAAEARPAEGFAAILNEILKDFDEYLKQPLKLLGLATGAAALCAVVNAACAGARSAGDVQLCGAAFSALAVAGSLTSLVSQAADAASRSAALTAAFVPVYAGLIISSGSAGSGAFYASAVMGAQSVFANVLTVVVEPLVGMLLGLSAVSGIRDSGIGGLIDGVKKTALWLLGGASTLFCGVVRLQTGVTASADTLALRASRFALSGAVPVIGRSVSEAIATVGGGLGVIRGSVGTVGILAITAIFVPVALRCILCSCALSLAAIFCDAADIPSSSRTLRGMKAGVDILCAVVVFNALCIIISTSTLITAGASAL